MYVLEAVNCHSVIHDASNWNNSWQVSRQQKWQANHA